MFSRYLNAFETHLIYIISNQFLEELRLYSFPGVENFPLLLILRHILFETDPLTNNAVLVGDQELVSRLFSIPCKEDHTSRFKVLQHLRNMVILWL